MKRRRLLGLLPAALASSLTAALVPGLARAQPDAFPQRPVTLWLPWPAGAGTDITMRLLANLAGRHLGQKILVDNRAGAGGTLVMPVLQQAAPDGYTIGQMPQPVFRAPHTQKVLWDPIRDTTPILQLSGVTFGIVVPAASGLRSLDDLFAFAERHPDRLSISTNGAGTTPHVVLDELFGRRNLRYIHVPYKGTPEQMLAVASGHVMAGVNSTGFAPFVDSGTLRLLVTFGEHRTKRWPQVPTLKELATASSPPRPTAWRGRAACRARSCATCTTRSGSPSSTRCTSPNWPSTTRSPPTSAPRTMRDRCASHMPPSAARSSGWG